MRVGGWGGAKKYLVGVDEEVCVPCTLGWFVAANVAAECGKHVGKPLCAGMA